MNSNVETKMNGVNTWFIIEILSFYGYILSAVIFITTNILTSSCGKSANQLKEKLLNQNNPRAKERKITDRYKYDFIQYYSKDLDWAAFVQILFNVNMGLILIDKYIIFRTMTEKELAT